MQLHVRAFLCVSKFKVQKTKPGNFWQMQICQPKNEPMFSQKKGTQQKTLQRGQYNQKAWFWCRPSSPPLPRKYQDIYWYQKGRKNVRLGVSQTIFYDTDQPPNVKNSGPIITIITSSSISKWAMIVLFSFFTNVDNMYR